MRVALITANIGGYDPDVPPIPTQSIPTENRHYLEYFLPRPLPRLDNRMRAKYCKCQPHRYLDGFDYYIWYDSSVEIISPEFSAYMVGLLENSDMVLPLHWERKTAMEEIRFVEQAIREGHVVLTNRYGNESIDAEADYYVARGLPEDYPIYVTRFFAWKNSIRMRACMDDWWRHCLEFSSFDQSMLSLMAYLHKIKINGIRYDDVGALINVRNHLKNW